MLSDKRKKKLRKLIRALDDESERLLNEAALVGTDGYAELMKKRTTVILRREMLVRMNLGNIPHGINSMNPIPKTIRQ